MHNSKFQCSFVAQNFTITQHGDAWAQFWINPWNVECFPLGTHTLQHMASKVKAHNQRKKHLFAAGDG
jgi:hypothetical protein